MLPEPFAAAASSASSAAPPPDGAPAPAAAAAAAAAGAAAGGAVGASGEAAYKAPCLQQWASVLDEDDEDDLLAPACRPGAGQVRQITVEVEQDKDDPAVFMVEGKDKSWFIQKGGMMLNRPTPEHFRLHAKFLGGARSRFGDEYADMSRAEQHATINWLLMAGVARGDYELTGYRDCKSSGFYFLFHLNYRRTRWRIIGCPHTAELEDTQGRLYTCNPQDGGQFELLAYEGQTLTVEYADRELWLVDGGQRVLRGHWAHGEEAGAGTEEGKLPASEYYPTILTPNCPTELRVEVA